MHTHAHTHTQARAHTHTHTRTQAHTHARTHNLSLVLQKLGLDEVAHELLAPAASGGMSRSGGAPTSTTSADSRDSRDCLRYDDVAPSRGSGSASKEKALSFKAVNTTNQHGCV
jgi:hypothetical protein